MANQLAEGCAIGLHPWGPWSQQHGVYTRQCRECGKVQQSATDPEPPNCARHDPYADL